VDYLETSFPITAVAMGETGNEIYSGGIDNDIKVSLAAPGATDGLIAPAGMGFAQEGHRVHVTGPSGYGYVPEHITRWTDASFQLHGQHSANMGHSRLCAFNTAHQHVGGYPNPAWILSNNVAGMREHRQELKRT
jgi:hypothetical protein